MNNDVTSGAITSEWVYDRQSIWRAGPVMKFTLTYDGELPATGNSSGKALKKWEVRKRFDPQLRELWHVHPALSELRFRRYWPRSGGFYIESHHSTEEERQPIQVNDGDIDLLADQKLGGKLFR
jgi:hypothetical protein